MPNKLIRRSASRNTTCTYLTAVILLLFSTISVPKNFGMYLSVDRALSAVPVLSVVSEVGDYNLTQTRYSDLALAIPLSTLLLLSLVAKNSKRVARLRFGGTEAWFLVFGLVAGFSAFVFREYIEALKLLLYALLVLGYRSCTLAERESIAALLLKLCMFGGVVNAVLTLLQYVVLSGGSFTLESLRVHRPEGIFGDSILSALFCVVVVAVVAFGNMEIPFSHKFVTVCLCLMAGVSTGSRTFYYLLAMVLVVFLFSRSRGVALRWKLFIGICVAGVSLFVFGSSGQGVMNNLSLSDAFYSRDLKQELALQLFYSSPVFGIGTGQYAAVEAAVASGDSLGLHGTNPHNIYLQVLCENGLAGFIPLLFAFVCVVKETTRLPSSLAMVLMMIYLVVGFSLGILYSVAFTAFFVALVSALLSQGERELLR